MPWLVWREPCQDLGGAEAPVFSSPRAPELRRRLLRVIDHPLGQQLVDVWRRWRWDGVLLSVPPRDDVGAE